MIKLLAIIVVIVILYILWNNKEKFTEYKKAGDSLFGAPKMEETWYSQASDVEKREVGRFGNSWLNVIDRGEFPDTKAGNMAWSSLIYGEILNSNIVNNADVEYNSQLLSGKNYLDADTRRKLCIRPRAYLSQFLYNDSNLC